MAVAVEGFDFGENWGRFLPAIDEPRIAAATASLGSLLGRDRLDGLSFLDIGCGSGLFSLAAHRLGAHVHSFDHNPSCVACASALRERHGAGTNLWIIEQGSVLDTDYLHRFARFDIVYSWGVLHHTGAMWQAIEHAASLVTPGGSLVIALYHETPACGFWKGEKKIYVAAPRWARRMLDGFFAATIVAYMTLRGRNPIAYIRDYRRTRGMSFMTDIRDWLGGYPYESAAPARIIAFMKALGFEPSRVTLCNARTGVLGTGCDEYVFRAGNTP